MNRRYTARTVSGGALPTRTGPRAAAVLMILGAILRGGAAVGQDGGLGLQDAIRAALAHNRALNATRQNGLAARAGLTQARAGFLPRVDAVEAFTETDNPTLVFSNLLNQRRFTADNFAINSLNHPASLSNFNTRFRVEQPLFAGGAIRAGVDAARESVAAADGQQARAEQATVFETRRAYYGVLLADGGLSTVNGAMSAASGHLETARTLFDRGVVLRSDLLRAEVLVGGLERQRIDAENATRTARSHLAYVMGTDQEIRLHEADAWPVCEVPRTLDPAIDTALRQRPDLEALEHEWQRREAVLRQARARYLPAVGVVGQYDLNSENLGHTGESYAVFVDATWNVFDGLATTGKAREAAAEAARSQLLYNDLAARVKVEVEQAWRGVTGATRQVDVAQRNQQQAHENLAIVRDRYAGGLARSIDVLDAVATAEQVDVELLQARVNCQVRLAELDLATGQPIPTGTDVP